MQIRRANMDKMTAKTVAIQGTAAVFAINLFQRHVQLLLTGIVMVINQEFFVSGTKSLLRGSPNMDTLVSLGAAASYGWSVYALFAMTDAQLHGGSEAAMAYMDEFYFESAAMILTLITVGKLLEAHSKGKTTDALKSLMALAPETATVIRDGKEVKIPAALMRFSLVITPSFIGTLKSQRTRTFLPQ